jgi:hypothetical protein
MAVEKDRYAWVVCFTSCSLLPCVCPLFLPRCIYSISVSQHSIVLWSSSQKYEYLYPWASTVLCCEVSHGCTSIYPCARTELCREVPHGYMSIYIRESARYCVVKFLTDVRVYIHAPTQYCAVKFLTDVWVYIRAPTQYSAVKFLTDIACQGWVTEVDDLWLVTGYCYKKTLFLHEVRLGLLCIIIKLQGLLLYEACAIFCMITFARRWTARVSFQPEPKIFLFSTESRLTLRPT